MKIRCRVSKRIGAWSYVLLVLGCALSCAPEVSSPSPVPFDVSFRRRVSTSGFSGDISDAVLLGDSVLVFIAGGGKQLFLSRYDNDTLRSMAATGGGPCEIEGATALLALSDTTFAMADAASSRVQIRSVGRCLSEVSTRSMRPSQLFSTVDGILVRARRAISSGTELLLISSDTTTVVANLRSSGDAARESCVYCRLAVLSDGSIFSATGIDSLYRILRYSPKGELVRIIEREDVSRARVLPRDADSIASLHRQMLGGAMTGAARRALEQAILEYPREAVRPLFQRGPLADEVARVLLVPRWPESGNPLSVDVFDLSSHQFLGELKLPEGTLLLRSTKQGVLGMRAVNDSVMEFATYRVVAK